MVSDLLALAGLVLIVVAGFLTSIPAGIGGVGVVLFIVGWATSETPKE